MSLITKPKTWIDNDNVLYTDLNGDFDTLYNLINGNIDNDNIKASANIDPAKISGTALTISASQVVTGQKTFVKPILNASVQAITVETYPQSGNIVPMDMTVSNVHVITLIGNATLQVSGVAVGQYFSVELIQDATGGRSVTWFDGIKWTNVFVPILSTTANRKDTFVFRCTGTNTYDGYVVGQNIG